MTAWSQNDTGNPRRFADRFFGPSAGNPAVITLFAAALGARFAASHADLREASDITFKFFRVKGNGYVR